MKYNIITPDKAKKQGFRALTFPISPETEQWIIDGITANLDKGKIPYVIVKQSRGLEVWRKPRCL